MHGQLYAPATLRQGEELRHPLIRRPSGPQGHSGRFGEEKNLLPLSVLILNHKIKYEYDILPNEAYTCLRSGVCKISVHLIACHSLSFSSATVYAASWCRGTRHKLKWLNREGTESFPKQCKKSCIYRALDPLVALYVFSFHHHMQGQH